MAGTRLFRVLHALTLPWLRGAGNQPVNAKPFKLVKLVVVVRHFRREVGVIEIPLKPPKLSGP